MVVVVMVVMVAVTEAVLPTSPVVVSPGVGDGVGDDVVVLIDHFVSPFLLHRLHSYGQSKYNGKGFVSRGSASFVNL